MYFDVLKEVSDVLNSLNILWAVGGSLVLYNNGIWDKPKDIDILINFKDASKVKDVMDLKYERLNLEYKASFRTKEFFGYVINGINIEFMADFTIVTDDEKEYNFLLDNEAVVDKMNVNETCVNVTSLEDWFVCYALMKDPKGRIPIIKEYFSKNEIQHKNLFERNLKRDIPNNIKKEIINLLERK